MSPLPASLVDRWQDRAEPSASDEILYWHILMSEYPAVQELAELSRSRLAACSGLHFPPPQWLHMTTYVAGPLSDFGTDGVRTMLTTAEKLLASAAPVAVSFGKVFYHPEAIVLPAQPPAALGFVYEAAREATRSAQVSEHVLDDEHWVPHVTVAYSTARQPAEPIIKALGRTLPECRVAVNNISLVVQEGPERLWRWRTVSQIRFGAGR